MGKSLREREIKREEEAKFYLEAFSCHNSENKYSKKYKKKPSSWKDIVTSKIEDALCSYSPNKSPESFKPKSFNKERNFIDFINHLFVKYKVPHCLYKIWNNDNEHNHITFKRFISAFISIGNGLSFHKNFGKSFLSKNESHFFTISPDLSIKGFKLDTNDHLMRAIIWSKLKARKIENLKIFNTVLNSKMFEKFSASLLIDNPNVSKKLDSWIDFFVKFEIQEKNLLNDILDFLSRNDVDLKGRTLTSVINLTNEWHKNLQKNTSENGGYSWFGLNIDDWIYEDETHIVTIEQLKTSKALFNEGRKMRHCVGGYVDSCHSGKCSIFSLKIDGKHYNDPSGRLTIEINNKSLEIRQARGVFNKLPTTTEMKYLRKWASLNKLRINKYIS